MNGLPIHPALVHVPLGLAVVLPLLAIGFAWALWRGRIGRGVWAAIVGLQALLLATGLAAIRTGGEAEEKVEHVVPEAAIETHESRAEAFVWLAGGTLVLATAVLVVPGRARRVLGAVTAAATVVVAGAGVLVGEAGGHLVYRYGAARVYAIPAAAPAGVGHGDDESARPPPGTPKAYAGHPGR